MLKITTLALAVIAGSAATALGAGSPAVPGPLPAPGVAAIAKDAKLCSATSANFRVWWGDTPGAAISLEGADRRCETLPPAAADALNVAELFRTRVTALGFPRLLGDAVPFYTRKTAVAKRLAKLKPAARARSLGAMSKSKRGPLLAGFSAAERRAVLKGIPGRLRNQLTRELQAALRGGPKVFVGGDRKLDIVLHASRKQLTTTDGAGQCRRYRLANGKPAFRAMSFVVFSPGPKATYRAPLAHELFRSVECRMLLPDSNAPLLREGAAEAMAAVAFPEGYAGSIQQIGTTTLAFGGAAQTIGFCSTFDPRSTEGRDPYRSWAPWAAIETAQPGTIRAILQSAVTTPLTTSAEVLAAIGDARWSGALARATKSVCGNLTSPTGKTTFPAAVRDRIAGSGSGTLASPVTPAALSLSPGGVRAVTTSWTPTSTSVTIHVRIAGVTPAKVLEGTVVTVGGVPLALTTDATDVLASVPAGSIPLAKGIVSIANPAMLTSAGVTVSVVEV